MRTFLLLTASLLLYFFAATQQTQPTNNLLLGYQEFPTTITSHTANGSGSQYYTGHFRGQLKVNNQVLTTGNGLEDIFWVKTDSNGNVTKFKTYGSANTENSYVNSLAMGTSNMLFGFSSFETLQLDNLTFVPYTYTNSSFASGLVCADTTGTVLWVRKTNLQNFRISFSNNIYHVFGTVSYAFPAIKVDDVTVLDSIGRSGFVHLMLDESGNLLGAKSITARKIGQGITLLNTGSFSDKSLFLQFRVDGDSAFYINQTPVSLPPTFWNYQTLMKVDTSYHNYRLKILNPQRHAISGLGNMMFPSTVAADSVYVVFNCESNATPYFIDGVAQLQLRNNLYVFDSTLALRRQTFLGNSLVGSYPTNIYKRRIYFRHMLYQNGSLFLNGVYTGINESPLNAIPVKDTIISILPGIAVTVNQNGPSKSFMAKCNLNGLGGALQWYGDHSEYENINVTPAYLHPAGVNRLAFHQTVDNVWNPWIVDENLNIVAGSMRKNADGPEIPQMVKYFSDGSRLVLGYARGKTALDSNSNFLSNGARRDVFLVRLRANNQVAWFKRIHSTLNNSDIRSLEIRNGKAYFLVNYLGSQNDSNYIRVENNVYNVRVNASLLASVDTAGNINVLNLTNSLLRPVFLMNVGFFSNGDLAVATDVNPVAYLSFPNTFNPQIFRLNPNTGVILEGRKLMGSGLNLYTVQIDKNDQLYISGSSYSSSIYTLYLHNGSSIIDSLKVVNNTQPQATLLKMGWNRLQWLKRFSGNAMIKQNGDLVLLNDKPVMGIVSSAIAQPMYWDGQTVHNGFTAQSFSLVALNSDGAITHKKTLVNAIANYMRTGNSNQLYLSGILRSSMQIDTIQLGYAGGMVDALGLVLDSNLTAKKSFRVASPYSESMTDLDIYQDTIATLAYTAQTTAQVYFNRTAISASDYEEDAYIGTIVTRNNIVTGLNNPLPVLHAVSISPNPLTDNVLRIVTTVPEPLLSTCTVYQSNGQYVTSAVLQFTPGLNRYTIALPATVGKGVYHVVISNKRWTITRAFVVL